MRHVLAAVAASLLAACGVPSPDVGEGLPAELVAAPSLTLSSSFLAPGQPARLTARLGTRNKLVYFAYSTTGAGAGPCPPVLGGRCLGILGPALLGTARTNASGVAVLDFTVPPDWAGQPVWLQSAKGAPGAVVSNVVRLEVPPDADLHLPYGPDAWRGYQFGLGYQSAPSPVDLWWNNLELCAIATPLDAAGDIDAVAWSSLDAATFTYDCWGVDDGGGQAFAVSNRDGSMAVVRVADDYTTAYELGLVNHLGLDVVWPAPASRWGRVALPDPSTGDRGWIAGVGHTPRVANDLWWNNLELCLEGAALGTFAAPDDVDLGALATMTPVYDCYEVADGGGQAFGLVTADGRRAAVWVESYDVPYEGVDLNEIVVQISPPG